MSKLVKMKKFKNRSNKQSFWRKFKDDVEGAMTIYFVIVFTTMITVSGIAIDLARHEANYTKLHANVDVASLAAASLRHTVVNTPQQIVYDYLEKAGLVAFDEQGNQVGPYVVVLDEEQTINTVTYRKVSATADSDLNTMFLDILGVPTLKVEATSVAEERIPRVELSLILDISGSMQGSKLASLQQGAKEFVTTVLAANTASDPHRVSISLVPYNMQVNGGEALFNALGGTSIHNHSHCAEWPATAFNTMDFSPIGMQQAMQMTYVNSDSYDRFNQDWWENVKPAQFDYTRKDLYGKSGDYTYQYLPVESVDADGDGPNHPTNDGYYCRQENWAEILPFSNSETDLHNRIDAFEAGGNTSIDIAMKWGAALLNPNHQSAITSLMAPPFGTTSASDPQVIDSGFNGRPVAYGTDDTMKIVVLMTDGENTTEYRAKPAYRGSDSGRSVRIEDGVYDPTNVDDLDGALNLYQSFNNSSSWQRLSWAEYWQRVPLYTHIKRVGGGHWTNYEEYNLGNFQKNQRLSSICSATRDPDGDGNDEVIVFTIAYSATTNGKTAMQNCATVPTEAHYYSADQTSISSVFSQIGGVIEKLKLVQ